MTPRPSEIATPITIITGFLGSGKTTLILNLLPQLPKDYRVALLKNEYGDLAIDSKLASEKAISGVQELLNGCICCNLVGQLGDALATLRKEVNPDRIVIETSGSAFPATLALEVNRLAKETGGQYVLDGVVSAIDVENWQGYEDTSYTAKMQARYTDLIVLNKWELVSERRLEEVEDRVLDLEVDVPRIKSDRGNVPFEVLIGLDSGLAKAAALPAAVINGFDGDKAAEDGEEEEVEHANSHHHDHSHSHDHKHRSSTSHGSDNHQSEVNVLSITLTKSTVKTRQGLDVDTLDRFLRFAPKDEIYRIKALFVTYGTPCDGEGSPIKGDNQGASNADVSATDNAALPYKYVLNWAFGRWTITPLQHEDASSHLDLEMTIVTARDEAAKWQRRIENDKPFRIQGDDDVTPFIKRLL